MRLSYIHTSSVASTADPITHWIDLQPVKVMASTKVSAIPSALQHIANAIYFVNHTNKTTDAKIFKAFAYGHYGYDAYKQAAITDPKFEILAIMSRSGQRLPLTQAPVWRIARDKANAEVWQAVDELHKTDVPKAWAFEGLVREECGTPWDRDPSAMPFLGWDGEDGDGKKN